MWLWLGIGIAILAGILAPVAKRFQATSLWAGRTLWNPELGAVQPRGYQDAISDGWPSTLGLAVLLPFIAAGIAFIHSWWAGIVAFILSIIASKIFENTKLIPKNVDWYLLRFLSHACKREASYASKGDVRRKDAMEQIRYKIEALCELYLNTGTPVPDMETAKESPFGDYEYLLKQYKQ